MTKWEARKEQLKRYHEMEDAFKYTCLTFLVMGVWLVLGVMIH